jgi:hypothetical protein
VMAIIAAVSLIPGPLRSTAELHHEPSARIRRRTPARPRHGASASAPPRTTHACRRTTGTARVQNEIIIATSAAAGAPAVPARDPIGPSPARRRQGGERSSASYLFATDPPAGRPIRSARQGEAEIDRSIGRPGQQQQWRLYARSGAPGAAARSGRGAGPSASWWLELNAPGLPPCLTRIARAIQCSALQCRAGHESTCCQASPALPFIVQSKAVSDLFLC